MSLTILLQQEGVVAVAKPPGRLVVPGRPQADGSQGPPSLQEELAAQLKRRVWVVHRLDRDTSGVLLFALDAQTHRRLSQAFENGEVAKTYLALVEGQVTAPHRINAALVEGRKRTMRVARSTEEGKPAQTYVEPLQVWSDMSWVSCRPMTGRQHQIRVHLRHIGHPLVVDPLYGNRAERTCGALRLSRTPLHAFQIRWGAILFEAPVPADLNQLLVYLRTG